MVIAVGRDLYQVVSENAEGWRVIRPLHLTLDEGNPFIKRFAGILNVAPEVVAQAFQNDAWTNVLAMKKEHRGE